MTYLLNIVYLALLVLCSPIFIYQTIWKRKSRGGFAEKLLGLVPHRYGDECCIWLHAVSVGEVNLLAPIIQRLANRHEHSNLEPCKLVISTTTVTGYALAKTKYKEHCVFYCPLDFSWAVKRTLQRIRPDMLVLAELELWPNLINLTKQFGGKVAIINGRLSNRSYRGYRKIRPLLTKILSKIDYIAVQNETYAKRFLQLGAQETAVHVTGSMKFDGAETDRQNPQTAALRKLARIAKDDVVFLAGSTQAPEEAYALETYRKLSKQYPQLRLILVPRHPQRFREVADMLDRSEFYWQRRSALQRSGNRKKERILLIDSVGELGAWWGTANIGYVGGSMGSRGGQNMIEPAAYAVAVSFGPKTKNFRDVVQAMLEADAAVVVNNSKELSEFVEKTLEEPIFATSLGNKAASLVAKHRGATSLVFEQLVAMIDATQDRSPTAIREMLDVGKNSARNVA